MVTHFLPTSEVDSLNPGPNVGKLVSYDGRQFTVQNLDQLYWFPLPIKLPIVIGPIGPSVESDIKTKINK